MNQRTLYSGWAGDVQALVGHFPFFSYGPCSAFWAQEGNVVDLLISASFFLDDPHHLGYDFSSLLDDDLIANSDVLGIDVVLIVQGCPGNGAAGYEHRL